MINIQHNKIQGTHFLCFLYMEVIVTVMVLCYREVSLQTLNVTEYWVTVILKILCFRFVSIN